MKGILRSFEAVVAILIISSTFFILFSAREPLPEFDTINWRLVGFNSLKTLDDNNELTSAVLSNNTSEITSKLASMIPPNLNYQVIICADTCPSVSINSEKITSVHYFIVGNITSVQAREIVVYIWG